MEKKRLLIYVGLAYGLAWAYWFVIVYPMFRSAGVFTTPVQLAVALGMSAPALAVVLTRLITREGFRDSWVIPTNFRRAWHIYVLAWFGPLVLTIAGAVLYYLLNPGDFDPMMSYIIQASRDMAEATGADAAVDDATIRMSLLTSLAAVVIAPAVNVVACFGEEWGWRGYLLPKLLEQFSIVPTLLISGIIWGLWHAPITVLGHNYGLGYAGYPFTGIAMMCLFCIVLGVFMNYVTLRAGSCLPAIFAHGMINGCGQIGLLFSATGGSPFVGPMPTGFIGGAFFILAAIVMAWDLKRCGWDAPNGGENGNQGEKPLHQKEA